MIVLAKRRGKIYHPRNRSTLVGLCGEGWTAQYRAFGEGDAKRRGMRLCINCKRMDRHDS